MSGNRIYYIGRKKRIDKGFILNKEELSEEKTDMKVLSIIWKIPDNRLKGFSNDTNGLVIVRDLCEYLGRKVESYLLLGKEYLPEMVLGNIHIVGSKDIAEKMVGKSHLDIMKAAFEKALVQLQPDIVHIHDYGDFCRSCMKICYKRQIPYVFTAHGFIDKKQEIAQSYNRTLEWQKEVYMTPNIHIVAVGKGLANKIIAEYSNLNCGQVRVIQNGTDFKPEIVESNLKSELGLQGRKLLICPGKILIRKNQMQIVRAFQMLPKSLRKNIGVLFCGNDRLEGALQKAIEDEGLGDSLKYVGILNSAEIKEYYSISDGFITASISEGLSIAALEALAYGLPLVMFSDLECAMDLDDKKVSCFAEKRTDQSLADAIEEWATREWDRNYILKYADNFSMERVAGEYLDCYNDILNRSTIS